MKYRIPLVALALALFAAPAGAQGICGEADRFALSDDIVGIWSPCTVRPGGLVIDSTYLQNASAVGGTALAAYPLVSLRTGIARRLEFDVHTPSQIAESGLHGLGLYPATHMGWGLRYTAVQADRVGVAVSAEELPPMSRFSPNHVQPRYNFGVTTEYAVNRKLAVGLATTGTSSSRVGFARILPSATLKAGYDLTPATQITADVGTHIATPRHGGQSFGDTWINERLGKNWLFNVGLGTSFNATENAKAHYLASGFNYRI